MPEIPTFPPQPRRSLPVIVIVAIGIVSGAAGALLLFWIFPELRQANIPPGTQSVIVQGPGKVVIEESTRLNELRLENKRLVAGIYRSSAGLKIGGETIYPTGQLLGTAVLLTADGWFATTTAVLAKTGDILLIEGRPYRIEKLITDTASPFVMGRIAGAERLTSLTFSNPEDRYVGMTLWTLSANDEITKTALLSDKTLLVPARSDEAPAIVSSDKLTLALSLVANQNLPAAVPVFDLGGRLIGLTFSFSDGREIVLPSEALNGFMINILKFGTPRRPFLGVSYIFNEYSLAENNEPAVIIYGSDANKGVAPKSPAAKAGLKIGDRLLSVNGQLLNAASSLFDLIQQYNSGDAVTLEYRRQSEKREATVVLGELMVKK